jgi:hypothetical protein
VTARDVVASPRAAYAGHVAVGSGSPDLMAPDAVAPRPVAHAPPRGASGPITAETGAGDDGAEFDQLVAHAAERLRPALGHAAAQTVARELVLDAIRFALRWVGA